MYDVLETVWRTSLSLGALLILARILGRRTLAQLTFFDFVVGITLGNIASLIVADRTADIALILVSLVTIAFWVVMISSLSLKSLPARKVLEAQPLLVIYKGRILEDNLSKRYYNVNDLLELLREQGVFSPGQVEAALIETDGALSVLQRTEQQAGNSQNRGKQAAFAYMLGKELIIDGKLLPDNLRAAGMLEQDLYEKLKMQGVSGLEEVLLCLLTPEGELYIDKKADK